MKDGKARDVPKVDYSEEELEYRSSLIEDLRHAANQRAQKWVEFDDMDFETWYWRAKKANEGYIEPRRNKEDVKVVTGTTREKTNILVATLLNYNLEADITSYDEDGFKQIELGQKMEGMVRKSRELELPAYDMKRPLAYKELVGQGNVFVEEQWIEYEIPQKDLENLKWSEGVDPSKVKWKERMNKNYSLCNSSVITGLDMFPGNMREFFMELQPFVCIRRRLSRAEAKMRYGTWERFKYVPYELTNKANTDDEDEYNDFQMIQTEVNFVEEIRYFNKWTNEYMIMLNGVLMLPVGFPLSAMLGICEYPIAKGDAEPISRNFFYSRGVGAKTRMDQAMIDEMFKMMIVKTRKSYKPPLANRGNYNIGAEVYMPGHIFKGVDPDKLKPIGEHNGVTPAEFNMFKFVKGIIDDKTVSPIMEGQSVGSNTTAREVIEMKQQSMIKIGMPMLGIINLEKRMAWLRIYNILKNWTEPIDKRLVEVSEGVKDFENVYRKIEFDSEMDSGEVGREQIEFMEGVLPSSEQVLAEEEIIERFTGEKVKKTYINPEALASIKNHWYIDITPTEKSNSALKAARFEESVSKGMQIFMPLGKRPNVDYLSKRWATLNGESPEKWWEEAPDPMAQMLGGQPQGGGAAGPLAAQMNASAAQNAGTQSINQLLNAG